jgi:hypothetical protein
VAPLIALLFFFHWYTGELPPLVGVAVNVTEAPVQILLLGLALMFTDGVTVAFTVIVMVLLPALAGDAQAALLVIIQLSTSPLASPLSV